MRPHDVLLSLLETQIQLKLFHWQTKSFSKHKASDEFVSELTGLIDTFVETYQGRYSRIMLDKPRHLTLNNITDAYISKYVNEFRKVLIQDIPKICGKDDTDLLNIRDEMLSLVNKTIYLFSLE
jgi:hypothetical protein